MSANPIVTEVLGVDQDLHDALYCLAASVASVHSYGLPKNPTYRGLLRQAESVLEMYKEMSGHEFEFEDEGSL